ncbi:hypothetical protein ACVXHB_28485 [Escherichia coli]
MTLMGSQAATGRRAAGRRCFRRSAVRGVPVGPLIAAGLVSLIVGKQ